MLYNGSTTTSATLNDNYVNYTLLMFRFGDGNDMYRHMVPRVNIAVGNSSIFMCGSNAVHVTIKDTKTVTVTGASNMPLREVAGYKVPLL